MASRQRSPSSLTDSPRVAPEELANSLDYGLGTADGDVLDHHIGSDWPCFVAVQHQSASGGVPAGGNPTPAGGVTLARRNI